MKLFLFTFVFFVLAVFGMAVSLLAGRSPIRGSCGGVQEDGACEHCRDRCRERRP